MSMKYLKNVTKITFNTEKCIGCRMCIDVCPHEVFNFVDKQVVLYNKDRCMECGACSSNCPVEAIQVKSGVG